MRKRVLGRRFKRDSNERKALFKGLISALILHERIQTTEHKAKSVKSIAEKVITKTLKEGAKAGQFVGEFVNSRALEKLIKDVAPRFKNRAGGYTRITRLGKRVSDNASVVYLELVERASAVVPAGPEAEPKKAPTRKSSVKTKTKPTKTAKIK